MTPVALMGGTSKRRLQNPSLIVKEPDPEPCMDMLLVRATHRYDPQIRQVRSRKAVQRKHTRGQLLVGSSEGIGAVPVGHSRRHGVSTKLGTEEHALWLASRCCAETRYGDRCIVHGVRPRAPPCVGRSRRSE